MLSQQPCAINGCLLGSFYRLNIICGIIARIVAPGEYCLLSILHMATAILAAAQLSRVMSTECLKPCPQRYIYSPSSETRARFASSDLSHTGRVSGRVRASSR